MVAFVDSVIKATNAEARPYQRRIVGKGLDMFRGRHKDGTGTVEPQARSILVESPTGSGKTVMGWLLAKSLQKELSIANQELVVGWVAMRRNLLSQAAAENRSKGINVENAFMTSMFDKDPAELVEAKRQGKKVLLVVDEAQHDAASSMAHLHNVVMPDYTLGLSATPFRTDRVKLCFDKVIKDAGIHQLIQDDYLSRFHHYSLPNWNVETVAETYLREPARWGKSLFYFVNLSQCYALDRLLKQHGIVCDVVTGDSNIDDQLDAFREGEVPVLINCLKLTEGFDDPSLQTAFVRDSGKGPTMQMAGRVFRKFRGDSRFPALPFKQVVQSKQTRWPIIRTALPDQQYVWQEDAWASLTVNPKLNLINHNARMAIAGTQVELPEFILKKQQKGSSRARLRF